MDMEKKEQKKKNRKKVMKRGGLATAVIAILVLALLFGTGKLGFGTGDKAGKSDAADEKVEQSDAATVESEPESVESTPETETNQGDRVEIRIQGREYSFRDVNYGNSENTLEALLTELSKLEPETRIELVVDDDATKNAVDDLERALAEAGFTDVHK